MKSRNPSVVASLLLSAGLLASANASAGVLLGNGKLDYENDLTLVQAGAKTYAFLDLDFTMMLSHANALAKYGKRGFSVATDVHLRELFGAFGFEYGIQKDGAFALNVSDDNILAFSSHLQKRNFLMGSFNDTNYGQSWSCISISCGPGSFVSNETAEWNGHPLVGVYLVRQTGDVPEPGSFALIGLGVAGLAAARRRRKQAGAPDVRQDVASRDASGIAHPA